MWKRILVVLIALTAAWIVSNLPRPVTGKEYVRKTYATTSRDLGNITASLISHIRSDIGVILRSQSRAEEIASNLLAVHAKLRLTSVRLQLSKLEPSFGDTFSEKSYRALQRHEFEIADLLGQLLIAAAQLDAPQRSRLLASSMFQQESLAVISSLFYAISGALKTRAPLPAIFPLLDDKRIDSELVSLNGLLGKEVSKATSAFVICGGILLNLHGVLREAALECRELFGSGMHME